MCYNRLFLESGLEINALKMRYYNALKAWQNEMNALIERMTEPLREKALAMALQGEASMAEHNYVLQRAEAFYQFLAKGPAQ
jgi:uncharacterized protein with gpF-like domain